MTQRNDGNRQARPLSPVMAAAIEVDIEELVLHGFTPGSRFRIGDAFERELARLMEERGALGFPDRSTVLEQLNGPSFEVPPGSPAQSVGVQVAQSVYRGLVSIDRASTGFLDLRSGGTLQR